MFLHIFKHTVVRLKLLGLMFLVGRKEGGEEMGTFLQSWREEGGIDFY